MPTYDYSREEIDRVRTLHGEAREQALADLHRKADEWKKGYAIGESLSNLPLPARSSDHAIRGFLAAISHQHPTHQQNIFRILYITCRQWAENKKKGWFDLRNEATVEGAERIVEALGTDFPIPYI